MVTGILSANASYPSYELVMARLIEIGSQETARHNADGSKLPQVHALNSLRDIVKNSYLINIGQKSENILAECLELATKSLRSEV
jgi:hypothetical protein